MCNRTIKNSFSPVPRNEHTEQFPDFVNIIYGKKPKLLVYLTLLCCRSLRVVKTYLWVSGSWCVSPALYSGRQRSSWSTHSSRIMCIGVSKVCGYHIIGVCWSGELLPNEAEGYRGLAQHGGLPGWLKESDPAEPVFIILFRSLGINPNLSGR